jgi:hypothetical protein
MVIPNRASARSDGSRVGSSCACSEMSACPPARTKVSEISAMAAWPASVRNSGRHPHIRQVAPARRCGGSHRAYSCRGRARSQSSVTSTGADKERGRAAVGGCHQRKAFGSYHLRVEELCAPVHGHLSCSVLLVQPLRAGIFDLDADHPSISLRQACARRKGPGGMHDHWLLSG